MKNTFFPSESINKKSENSHTLNWNEILNRGEEVNKIKSFLKNIDINNIQSKRGIYLYGNSGIGKTLFMENILKEMDYNIIYYDVGDIKNKSIIDEIINNNISSNSILSMFQKKPKKNIIFIDEIDAMNTGDKSGLNTLIKLIRPKKTKKQKMEKISLLPIIFIGNYYIDKKIKELIKVCHTIELKTPNSIEISNILEHYILLSPRNDISYKLYLNEMVQFIQNDFRKLMMIIDIFNNEHFKNINIYDILKHIFCLKSYNENSKETVRNMMIQHYPIQDHIVILNETERTIIGLLWHENVVNSLEKQKLEKHEEEKEVVPELLSEKDCLEAAIIIADEIYENTEYDDLDANVKFLTSGLEKYGLEIVDINQARKVLYDKLSAMTIEQRKVYLTYVNQESMDQLVKNNELFNIFGPANAIINGNFKKTDHICYRYGGCRMLYCNCFEFEQMDIGKDELEIEFPNIPQWFKGQCERCDRVVQKRCYAVRRPLPQGGWRGTYCSWNCLYLSGNVEDQLSMELCNLMENQLNEMGIIDREEMDVEQVLKEKVEEIQEN